METKIYFSQNEINKFLIREYNNFYHIDINEVNNAHKLLIDSCGDYAFTNHAMWLYFRNGKNYTPIYVSDRPFIPIREFVPHLSNEEFDGIKGFVKDNYKEIAEFSNGRMDFNAFKESLMLRHFTKLNESAILLEMPTFPYYTLDLPTDIRIDGERNLRHGFRIKFNDTKNKDTRTWASMSINKSNPSVYNLSPKTFLSNDEIDFLKEFVKENYETLIKAANGEYYSSNEIKLHLKKIKVNNSGLIMPVQKGVAKIDVIVVGNTLILMVNDDKGIKLLELLTNSGVFKKYDKNSIYADIKDLSIKSEKNKLSSFVKNMVNDAAHRIGINVEYLNVEKLYRLSDRFA